ncbi:MULTISPECIES: MarR family winged helix-turn-helix transcriptional regulator [unclassified Marinobacterium]|jgi:DNA-binding MarR family transcriptional regulator|uniref:MarR family winged helix-turn-helix transcriptional regulator n=1 Tax=unclassified Marinobacterium TaxID=2644139 RepID=UPI00156821EC|nr:MULTISPECIES: MarR family transcriptional regulator [unclassified Marinobacterium]NRP27777.1 Multidrug resistance operon repressor [Marinobacterium sp. xm-d-420]NRP53277.1 Multidrug resistance operon repressor [Marinobacterium sp. xm-v-242]NRP78062.1 Multidrug resistance operon repressor [Marinobacterium sp. xm-m-383]NRP95272.1 Multidrug resistance operon repressor [Marinobacterium sp. xm-g-59]NRQ02516.1 Multidrug resistance operon repressor [Marinobacterium sp. xm-d-530]
MASRSKRKNELDVDLGLLGSSLGYHLRRAQLAAFNGFSKGCAELGISPGLFAVLEIVYRNPGLTQTAVANTLGTDRSAMVAAIDKLEKMNLLERCAAENDRRSYALRMTEHGNEWYQAAEQKVKANEEAFYEPLQDSERELLVDMLTRLSNRAEAQ